MELYRKVRLACRDGMSARAAARHFGISRESVRKMLEFSVPPGYRRTAPVRRPVSAASAACGAVSMMMSSAPASRAALRMRSRRVAWVLVTIGVSASRKSPHFEAEACGSRSMRTVSSPACPAATARAHAMVVFPPLSARRR